MKLKYFFLLLLTLLIGTVRYVSKTGTSTPPYTSWQTASDSIQKCINICVDGDTVIVANGVYKENLIINTAINLIGSSMDSTIIDGREMGNVTISLFSSFKIKNIYIYGKQAGFGDAIIRNVSAIELLDISECRMSDGSIGIGLVNSSITVKNAFFTKMNRAISLLSAGNSYLYDISNCQVVLMNTNCSGMYIGFADNSLSTLKNNVIATSSSNPDNGISLGAVRQVYISNNLISGFTYNVYFDLLADTAYIYNNLILYKHSQNNTFALNSENDNLVIKNNVFAYNKNTAIRGFPPYVKMDYNLFWQNQNDLYGLAYGDSDIVADPMFVNDTIPTANGNYDFHLQKYSPAIDKGDPSILDVDGSRSDIGLFGGPLGESYTYQDLAPKPPRNLTAVMDSGLVHLKWNKNTEADLFRYRVYRDTVPYFVYDTTKIIAVIPDTTFYDDPPQKFISGNYYYKITAIDSAYHQSPASEEVHINITGIPEAPPIVVEHYSLLQNYPNPFNPSTTIPYRLKASGYVKVMVYNLLGEQVKVLVNKYQSAGYYEVLFHPTATERQSAEGKIEFETGYGDIVSGIYLYRIEVIGEGNIPVFTDMKKMMLVK